MLVDVATYHTGTSTDLQYRFVRIRSTREGSVKGCL